jgi:hypothetical protein
MPWDCHLGSPHALGVEDKGACALSNPAKNAGVDLGYCARPPRAWGSARNFMRSPAWMSSRQFGQISIIATSSTSY